MASFVRGLMEASVMIWSSGILMMPNAQSVAGHHVPPIPPDLKDLQPVHHLWRHIPAQPGCV